MRGIYISPVDFNLKEHIGICSKMIGQINAFKNLNVEMDYYAIEDDTIIFNNIKTDIKLNRRKHYVFFKYILQQKEYNIDNYDFVYIRFSIANPFLFKVADIFKSRGVKVFIEIPTYPYYDELETNIKNSIIKIVDRYLWRKNKKKVDRVVLTNNLNSVFGISAINIINGIDLDDICIKNKIEKPDNTINMVAVANINKWHGYDRVIRGLNDYYAQKNSTNVKFYLVGEGVEKQNLMNLTDELNLNNKVCFLGAKKGKELEKIFDEMDIGVSSLALFRAGGGHDPIKSKEYVGRGIPVILAYNDRALPNDLPFIFSFSEDESNIDISEVIKKYKNMNISNNEIRKYAERNLTWESQMKKVVDAIDGE